MPDDYDAEADMRASVEWVYSYIRERIAAGDPRFLMWAAKISAEKAGKCPKTD